MTFQSLSALTLGPGASSVAKPQEGGAVRSDKAGQAGLDFSAFLSQAMQSKDWAGSAADRQGLAEPAPSATEQRTSQDFRDSTNGLAPTSTTSSRSRTTAGRDEAQTPGASTTGTHQELTQRALRTASLRTAQMRADKNTNARTSPSDTRARKAGSHRDDDNHLNMTPGNPAVWHPAALQQPAATANSTKVSPDSVQAIEASNSNNDAESATNALALNAQTFAISSDTAANTAGTGPSSGGLTTVQLSPQMQIITPGQGVVSEQSLQSFAQSMGIDPGQFKQLMTATPASSSVDISGLRAGVTATDALTGTPILPAAPVDPNAIDLSQVLPAGMVLDELHVEWTGNRRGNSLDIASPSTLDVLGMRDGGLGADAVTSLQESADTGSQGQQPDNTNGGMGSSNLGASARASAATANAAATNAPQNMAEHFEKLSAKLATEMAGRIHEQFSQGEWKMKFALKPASLGQVDVQLEMRDGKLAAVLQADNPMTQDLLQNGSQRLRDALSQMGLSQSSVSVGDGRSQAFQGDRHPGARGSASSGSQHQDSPSDSVQTVASAPRRDSLSQLDFYA